MDQNDQPRRDEIAPRQKEPVRPLFSRSELSLTRPTRRPQQPPRKRKRPTPTTSALTFSPSHNRIQSGRRPTLSQLPPSASNDAPENGFQMFSNEPNASHMSFANEDRVSPATDGSSSHPSTYPSTPSSFQRYPTNSPESYFPTNYDNSAVQPNLFGHPPIISEQSIPYPTSLSHFTSHLTPSDDTFSPPHYDPQSSSANSPYQRMIPWSPQTNYFNDVVYDGDTSSMQN